MRPDPPRRGFFAVSLQQLHVDKVLLPYIASFPWPPPFFVLQFSFSIAEKCKKWGRPGNTFHVNDVRWMQGGREVDVWGDGSIFK